jgi:hypothetical protein
VTSQQRLERRFAVLCPTLTVLGIAVFLLVPVSGNCGGGPVSPVRCGSGNFIPVWTLLNPQGVAVLGVAFVASVLVGFAGLRHASTSGARFQQVLIGVTVVLWGVCLIGIFSIGIFLAPAGVSATAASFLAGPGRSGPNRSAPAG